jgi:hypothetical protein
MEKSATYSLYLKVWSCRPHQVKPCLLSWEIVDILMVASSFKSVAPYPLLEDESWMTSGEVVVHHPKMGDESVEGAPVLGTLVFWAAVAVAWAVGTLASWSRVATTRVTASPVLRTPLPRQELVFLNRFSLWDLRTGFAKPWIGRADLD